MQSDSERTLEDYVGAVAAGTPAPGGGSVAAVVAALAAALGEMVANLTRNREAGDGADAELRLARERLATLRRDLLAAAREDETAYAAYRAALALPRRTDVERSLRQAVRQEALLRATEAPLAVARAATELASVLETVARVGNPRLASDTALGALLAEAALRGALLNVRGNAALLADAHHAAMFQEEAGRLEGEGRAAAERAFRRATGEGTAAAN